MAVGGWSAGSEMGGIAVTEWLRESGSGVTGGVGETGSADKLFLSAEEGALSLVGGGIQESDTGIRGTGEGTGAVDEGVDDGRAGWEVEES